MIRALAIAVLLLAAPAAEAHYFVRWYPVLIWIPDHHHRASAPLTRAELYRLGWLRARPSRVAQ